MLPKKAKESDSRKNFLWNFTEVNFIILCYTAGDNSLHAVKLNKYAFSALRRRFSWNMWLRIKTLTNQNFHFSMFSVDAMSSVF